MGPDHGLCGIDFHFLCVLFKSQLDRPCFKQIVVMGAGAVGIDIKNVLRLNSRVLYSI
mgnify:CR=1 FL=1